MVGRLLHTSCRRDCAIEAVLALKDFSSTVYGNYLIIDLVLIKIVMKIVSNFFWRATDKVTGGEG